MAKNTHTTKLKETLLKQEEENTKMFESRKRKGKNNSFNKKDSVANESIQFCDSRCISPPVCHCRQVICCGRTGVDKNHKVNQASVERVCSFRNDESSNSKNVSGSRKDESSRKTNRSLTSKPNKDKVQASSYQKQTNVQFLGDTQLPTEVKLSPSHEEQSYDDHLYRYCKLMEELLERQKKFEQERAGSIQILKSYEQQIDLLRKQKTQCEEENQRIASQLRNQKSQELLNVGPLKTQQPEHSEDTDEVGSDKEDVLTPFEVEGSQAEDDQQSEHLELIAERQRQQQEMTNKLLARFQCEQFNQSPNEDVFFDVCSQIPNASEMIKRCGEYCCQNLLQQPMPQPIICNENSYPPTRPISIVQGQNQSIPLVQFNQSLPVMENCYYTFPKAQQTCYQWPQHQSDCFSKGNFLRPSSMEPFSTSAYPCEIASQQWPSLDTCYSFTSPIDPTLGMSCSCPFVPNAGESGLSEAPERNTKCVAAHMRWLNERNQQIAPLLHSRFLETARPCSNRSSPECRCCLCTDLDRRYRSEYMDSFKNVFQR